jgi:hypothetical protein
VSALLSLPKSMHRIFLLSPASASGQRARLLLSHRSRSAVAHRVRGADGAPIGEVYAFLSGLYFRGKLTYARTFARPPEGTGGVWVITPNAGLLPPEARIDLARLRSFAEVDISHDEARYRRPLMLDAKRLAEEAGGAEVVLLGSIATSKYTGALLDVFGPRLLFPRDFVGRGDMSRGGLLLRAADDSQELQYVAVDGAILRGPRPPKLERRAPRATS